MARKRSRRESNKPSTTSNTSTDETTYNTDTTNTNEGERKMAVEELSMDEINSLLAEGRTKGDYDEYLVEFLQSGVAGQKVDLSEGKLAGKTFDKVKTGLNNARNRTYTAKNAPSPEKAGQLVHDGADEVALITKGKLDEEAGTDTRTLFIINKSLVTSE